MTIDLQPRAFDLTQKCRDLFGDQTKWVTASGYQNSLALGVIDSIYSTGSHYQSVINVVHAYCEYRREQNADPHHDGPAELLKTFEERGGSDGWASHMNNRKPASTSPHAVLKAEVVRQAAELLRDHNVLSPADLGPWTALDGPSLLQKAWKALPSQSSGITLNYLFILAGYQSIKPDRMIWRFIYEHTSLTEGQITNSQAVDLIKMVAAGYPTEARKLDHVIWRYASGREFQLPGSDQ